ncbi:MAG: hypothetical protein K8R49_05255, partial [Candidatus Cloacimonetes bacterium]|nr:hypothetical protein [Candidatus Cloacimonadota bacterium]
MKKKAMRSIINNIPGILNNLTDWIKNNYEDSTQDIMKNASGSIGMIIKLVGTPILNKYLRDLGKKRLAEYGFYTYMKAAYTQAAKSIDIIESDLVAEIVAEEVITNFSEITMKANMIDKNNIILIFQPKYHPIVIQIKNNYITLLKKLNVNQSIINLFKKDFNENISEEVEKTFGDDYDKHVQEISLFLTEKNESELIWDT